MIDGGQAIFMEIEGPGAAPTMTSLATSHYTWERHLEQVGSRFDIDHLAEKLRGMANDLDRVLIHLAVEGTLSLDDCQYFQDKIVDGASAAFYFMRIDDRSLFPRPTPEDLDQIDRGDFVRTASDELKRLTEEDGDAERDIAAEALRRLYIEHMKLQAGQR